MKLPHESTVCLACLSLTHHGLWPHCVAAWPVKVPLPPNHIIWDWGSGCFGRLALGFVWEHGYFPSREFASIYAPVVDFFLSETSDFSHLQWHHCWIKGLGEGQGRANTRTFYPGTALLNYSRTLMEMNHFNSLIDNEMNNKQQRVT